MNYLKRVSRPPTSAPRRLARGMWRQSSKTPLCPATPRLDGRLALVTGGNAGIGLEISRGLAARGAEVIIAARNERNGEIAVREINCETGADLTYVGLDLSDLESVVGAIDEIAERRPGRSVDVLVENAGIWPRRRELSAQGHEIAFATNVLGHFALARRMINSGLLAEAARVVALTGDIYILANECTSDFEYRGERGCQLAYSRSKLGNLWFAAELQRLFPNLEVCIAHPGVIASDLGGLTGVFASVLKRLLFLDTRTGAQTPLICATQPGLERGGYYHNTMGRVIFAEDDPAADEVKAGMLWAHLDELAAGYV
jgi:NAD(P)-dependent dehydrogenase (short-subunit alcohol dehydrogenase family)